MEKFLWNVGGYAIAALSVFAVLLLLARQDIGNALFCVVCLVASWLYMRYRPTWIEV